MNQNHVHLRRPPRTHPWIQFLLPLNLPFTLDRLHVSHLNHVKIPSAFSSLTLSNNCVNSFHCFPACCALRHALLLHFFSHYATTALMDWQGFPLTALCSGNWLQVAARGNGESRRSNDKQTSLSNKPGMREALRHAGACEWKFQQFSHQSFITASSFPPLLGSRTHYVAFVMLHDTLT